MLTSTIREPVTKTTAAVVDEASISSAARQLVQARMLTVELCTWAPFLAGAEARSHVQLGASVIAGPASHFKAPQIPQILHVYTVQLLSICPFSPFKDTQLLSKVSIVYFASAETCRHHTLSHNDSRKRYARHPRTLACAMPK